MRDQRPEATLLAHLVAYHRREAQPGWWAFYHRRDNVDQLLEFDREALGGLRHCDDVPPERESRSFVYTYSFPEQSHKMEPGVAIEPRTKRQLTIVEVDDDCNRLRVKTTAVLDEARDIKELIPRGPYDTSLQQAALQDIGEAFLEKSLDVAHPATVDLLAARDPRPGGILQPECVTPENVSAAVGRLDRSYIFVQGPPGSGKSTIGAHVICDLLANDKRVAIMSTGHKANHNLLRKIEVCMAARGKSFKGRYKHTESDSEYVSLHGFIESVSSTESFAAPDYQLAGGTAWLFSRPDLVGQFDYLFIDEAGQVSLADALAVSLCAKNVVLLGDPSQLAQVSQASHPTEAASASVLEHLLGDAKTVLPNRGIFLDVSYRMQPQICAFISDAMYEGRLKPAPDTAMHAIIDGRPHAGLRFMPVAHEGNSAKSPEEADRIVGEMARLLQGSVIDSQPASLAGVAQPMQTGDLIVVTPYNAQRRLIRQKLRAAGIEVAAGTVDKFQGQEAPVVFYSMATSSGEDVPRDMKFLFERNRFNVAISRARAVSVLVCSPRLLDAACNSAEEMALVNLLCLFAERAAPEMPALEATAGTSPV
ncbi:MAG: DEAD/DEAH box helicase [Vulcanimicrobiaceae bacterium]